jgi:hypothetical protein
MTVHHEQITLIVHRPPNTGLGISIAGGIGSTAYKDNDYVSFIIIETYKVIMNVTHKVSCKKKDIFQSFGTRILFFFRVYFSQKSRMKDPLLNLVY